MSSRLAVDNQGRPVCIVTVASESLQVGQRLLVVDMFELGFTRPGRPPTAQERMKVPDPYGSAWRNGWDQRASGTTTG